MITTPRAIWPRKVSTPIVAAARADDVERSEEEDLAESARPSRRAALREKLDEKSSSPGEQPGGGR